ncbi:MAG: hypothetical protein P0116_06680 [Candidatus Nitrosocosmicus sp.]|nr:hypothetical protein [Candidatus Nitrosocosmicus sp.]
MNQISRCKRSPQEYANLKITSPPEYPTEHAQGGAYPWGSKYHGLMF